MHPTPWGIMTTVYCAICMPVIVSWAVTLSALVQAGSWLSCAPSPLLKDVLGCSSFLRLPAFDLAKSLPHIIHPVAIWASVKATSVASVLTYWCPRTQITGASPSVK